jgi:membrane-bound serine protease (ClpP class)
VRHAPRVWVVAVGSMRMAAVAALAVAVSLAQPERAGAQTPSSPDNTPRVVIGEYDGIIHPIAAEFVDDLLSRAENAGAAAAILVLRTPGGLLDSTRTIVSRLIASRVPVVVYVAPSGARAASAGFLIIVAADVAVMAPGTHIGAAHPVSAGREGEDSSVTAEKATEDAAAYARTLAQGRQRNATLAAAAVIESRAFTEGEALAAQPPLIDFVAADLDDLLRQLDGRDVRRFDGSTVRVRVEGATTERVAPSWRQSLLGAIAHPQVAYLLLTLGTIGLMVEFWNPGFVLPGVAGGLCLLLAFFAFQVLPINLTGVLLLVFGLALLGAELMVPSFGVLGVGGIVALLAGSLMITRDVPEVRVGYGVIVPAVVAVALVVLGLGRLAMQAQRLPSVSGLEGLVGARAEALTACGPQQPGQVLVQGEIWRAVSDMPIVPGQPLRVVAADGLTLRVQPFEPVESPGGLP